MKIIARNFLSWSDLEFEIGPGVTLISGFNHDDQTSEGSGKSAILNALSWGLYGKIPKDANIDEVIKEGEKSASVQITHPRFSIVRERGPNDLYFVLEDGKPRRGSSAIVTQKEIEKLIGMSFETFCQSIYFAQNYPNKFITANQENKAKILSEILDLDQFDRARKVAADRIKTKKEQLIGAKKDVEKFQTNINWATSSVTEVEISLVEFEAQKVRTIKDLLEEIEKVQGDAAYFEKSFQESKDKELKEFKNYIAQNAEELESVRVKIRELEQEFKGILDADLNNEKSELELFMENSESLRQKKGLELVGIESSIKDQDKKVKDLSALAEALVKKDQAIKELKRDLEDRNKDVEHYRHEYFKLIEPNPDPEKCPTCGQNWDGNLEHRDKEINSARLALARAEKVFQSFEKQIESLKFEKKDLIQTIKFLNDEITLWVKPDAGTLSEEMKTLTNQILEYKNRIKKIESILVLKAQNRTKHAVLAEKKLNLSKEHSRLDEEQDKIEEKTPDKELERFYEQMQKIEDRIIKEDSEEPISLKKKLTEARNKLQSLHGEAVGATLAVGGLEAEIIQLEALREGYKEVKAYTFDNTLAQLSKKANAYLNELFSQPVKLKFKNEDFKIETTVTIDGKERTLGLYSGGQFRRIDLATALALSDLVTSRVGNLFNLLILDEFFKDLSEVSMERVLKILENRKTPTLLIEHNSVFSGIVNNTVEVELRSGVSRRVS